MCMWRFCPREGKDFAILICVRGELNFNKENVIQTTTRWQLVAAKKYTSKIDPQLYLCDLYEGNVSRDLMLTKVHFIFRGVIVLTCEKERHFHKILF
jgi:hypothetical protein